MSAAKRRELRARTLTEDEVSDLRALHHGGSSREVLQRVERIVAAAKAEAYRHAADIAKHGDYLQGVAYDLDREAQSYLDASASSLSSAPETP